MSKSDASSLVGEVVRGLEDKEEDRVMLVFSVCMSLERIDETSLGSDVVEDSFIVFVGLLSVALLVVVVVCMLVSIILCSIDFNPLVWSEEVNIFSLCNPT